MDPKKFFAELTRRNGYKIAKSCFLLRSRSRSPGVAGKLVGLRWHKSDFKHGGVGRGLGVGVTIRTRIRTPA